MKYIAKFWQKFDKDRIQCELCPRQCIISHGQKGFCASRKNVNGELVLECYGRCSALCIDPIEKKPLYHFYPGSKILSLGTVGCNLGCDFCQNAHISTGDETALTEEAQPENIVALAKEMKCSSVAFTYNEPLIFAEYAIEIAKLCRKEHIKTVAVTAGYVNEIPRKEFFQFMDAANVDLKAFNNDFYKKFCKVELEPVLDTLKHIHKETNVWLEITNLLIPGENDSSEEIDLMCKWINNELGPHIPLHFSAFHPAHKMTGYPQTLASLLESARQIALNNGLKYVYTGNVYSEQGSTTFCDVCKNVLIKREWFSVSENNLIHTNSCPKCHSTCAGHF